MDIPEIELGHNDACEPHRIRTEEEKNASGVISWGQRKLFIVELLFITRYVKQTNVHDPIVLYVGAAPGTHLPYLADLFEKLRFELYDPQPFESIVHRHPRIAVHQEMFTATEAEKWKLHQQKHKNVFLISDIRNIEYSTSDDLIDTLSNQLNQMHLNQEMKVIEDMNAQMEWHLLIRPCRSMLKFRLPYCDVPGVPLTIEYLDGTILKQAYSPKSSTETRLVVDGNCGMRKYECLKYEQQMFYHNTVIRPSIINNQYADVPELMHDYDSRVESMAWMQYLQRMGQQKTISEDRLPELIAKLSRKLTEKINVSRSRNKIKTLESLRLRVKN
jgi:hypothetical protein